MSTMEDTKEIEAFDAYTSKMGVAPAHVIRSHRAPRLPQAFPIRRLLLAFTAIAMAAGFINFDAVSLPRHPVAAEAFSVPEAIRWIDPKVNNTPRVDTGSEVDTGVTMAIRSKPQPTQAVRRVVLVAKPKPKLPVVKQPSIPKSPRQKPPANVKPAPKPNGGVEIAISYALAQQGKPYRWAQAGPNGFDCSGLVLASFARIGIKLPHFTGTMMGYGRKVSKAQLQRGDVIFPTSGHVGIYLGNGMMVHASSGKSKVVVSKMYSFYTARRMV